MKNDTGKIDVEEKLAESFRELVKQKNPDKITVREITDGAGVIRATFYNHFNDKADLLQYIIREKVIEPVRGLFRLGMYREAVVLIFQAMKDNEEFFMRAAVMTKPFTFEEIAYQCVHDLIYSHMKAAGVKRIEHPWLTTRMIADLYAHFVSYITMEWIGTNMKATPEEIGLVFEYIGTKPLWNILAAIEKDPGIVRVLSEPGNIHS